MADCLIAYNPTAGRYPSRMLVERAGKVFEDIGWSVQLEPTTSGEHLARLARQSAQQRIEYFIVAGGDGSINRAMSGLVGSDTALGVLPAGTSNVWAQELGLPGLTWTRWMALEESARRLADGQVCQVDIGLCNDEQFLLWAGVGLDGFIVNRIEPRSRWEKHFAVAQYAASVIWHASIWHGMNLRIDVDGERLTSGHYILAVVSNVRLYAGGIAELSPRARLDDGLMDLWLFDGETLGDTVQLALELLAGTHTHSEKISCIKFTHLRMESDSPVYVQLDGEPIAGNGRVSIKVKQQALHVLIPRNLPHKLFR